ncbi:Hypothetical_protein [Hexamita inflata]|uniref:Hypothetical_protein n=1 Tax=Hexamita inflata TaxID=28002 RepID=A0ABP1KIC1_9EUKA
MAFRLCPALCYIVTVSFLLYIVFECRITCIRRLLLLQRGAGRLIIFLSHVYFLIIRTNVSIRETLYGHAAELVVRHVLVQAHKGQMVKYLVVLGVWQHQNSKDCVVDVARVGVQHGRQLRHQLALCKSLHLVWSRNIECVIYCYGEPRTLGIFQQLFPTVQSKRNQQFVSKRY